MEYGLCLRVADLDKSRPRRIEMALDEPQAAHMAEALGIVAIRKARLEGTLSPLGKRDWQFEGHLGATVVQTSVVTLDPVTTRIEEDIRRNWVARWEVSDADESEVPEDVDQDELGTEIDLGALFAEAIALALPDFPRGADEALGEAVYTEPGKAAMTDEETKPFAGLAALRDKLAGEDEG